MLERATRLAVILALTMAWSCKGRSAWQGTVETVNGVQVVHNPKIPIYPQGALELHEDLSIGAAEGSEEYMFVRLRGLAVDGKGEIFSLDQRKPRVDVFASDGRHLRSMGRQGQGPGEFQSPFYIALAPAGELLVGDMARLNIFDRNGTFLRSVDNSVQRLAFLKYLENGDAVGTRIVLDEEKPRYEVALCGPDLEQKAALLSSFAPNPSGKFTLFVSVVRWDVSHGREIVCASGEGD
jgi:hypothetical protein